MNEQVKLEMFTAELDSELELQYSQVPEGSALWLFLQFHLRLEQGTGATPFLNLLCSLCRRLYEG